MQYSTATVREAILFLLLPIVWASTVYAQPQDRQGADPPNIVLFIADDLGTDDVEPYGNTIVRTPNLERLAEQAMRFTQAFVASPTCSPSRSALYTGLMPFRNGAHANHTGVRDGTRSIVQYLEPLGYRVAIAGKLHVGPREVFSFERIANTNVPQPGYEDRGVLFTDLNLAPVDTWLSKVSKDEPFALIVADHSPHVVWPEDATYDAGTMNVPLRHIDTPEYRAARARYYTDVTKMDRNVGRLLESLDQHGFTDNTLFVFVSDHGPQFPFGKWGLYDYGVQTPLLVRWPGHVKPGTTTDALVSLVDVLPTFIEAAGGSAPEGIDGQSFLPVLRGKTDAHREVVFASHTGDANMNRSPMRMIRTARYKYILNLAPEMLYTTHMDIVKNEGYWDSWRERSFEDEHASAVLWRYHYRPKEELYDLKADPRETQNLAGDPEYAELLEDLRKRLAEWRAQQGDFETGPFSSRQNEEEHRPPYIF